MVFTGSSWFPACRWLAFRVYRELRGFYWQVLGCLLVGLHVFYREIAFLLLLSFFITPSSCCFVFTVSGIIAIQTM
ncbi:uncharacterized protein BCR38DRAFT_424203 [Pseudomassariella vexata]|uniref:Uncharacterized protein n=1 Tax=Pseudomassariella vexata TaxID=1141098 RepID=A0A1Y2EAZ6_9PEZI|nr:uncharacterized protein BCR38DRAFT_424203 [Pseudomassariella vexata]ORY68739.1 hypothetical protein BCR38DRAFT_424203 [Pseudomassariella vexata]